MEIFVAFLVFFLSLHFSNRMYEKALLLLEDEKKLQLIELFRKDRNSRYIFPIILFVVYFLVLTLELVQQDVALYAIITFVLAYFIYRVVFSRKKLSDNYFPKDFIKSYSTVVFIRGIGLIALVAGVVSFYQDIN